MAIGRPVEAAAEIPEVAERRGWLAVVSEFCRKRPLGAVGAAVVLINVLVGIGANVIAPYDPVATDYGAMLARPSASHWLGTDAFGRDVLSRIIYGSRTAMLVGFACAFLGATVGAVIGVASALLRRQGRSDLAAGDGHLLAFPLIILALAVCVDPRHRDRQRDHRDRDPDDPARRARDPLERAGDSRDAVRRRRARGPDFAIAGSSCATCCRTSWRRT
jgi:hypothetical protein